MSPSTKNFRPRKASNRIRRIYQKPMDPIITAQRFMIPSAHIPQHNIAPSVSRTVRIVIILTSGAPAVTLQPFDIANRDALDYTATTSLRYLTMRFISAKFWAESPANLSVSQSSYGLVIYEPLTAFTITDRPTTNSRLNAIGLKFPFAVRTTPFPCTNNTTNMVEISCDTTIASDTNFTVTCDFTVEFYA
jgi:hypothetical protein